MDSSRLLLFIFVCILNPYRIKSWNLPKEDDLELERQLKHINKPAIKTISTRHGEIYDCVDFYKQPAFDHPLLKNFTLEKSTLLELQRKGRQSSNTKLGFELEGGGCPLGTVPIKRVTKEDLIRQRLASKIRPLVGNGATPIYARVKTQGTQRYGGMSGSITVYNPPCVDKQYSAARLKISNGADSVEAGWRVDPTLFKDNKTRFYIRTDVGQTHCFNLDCPGFVAVSDQRVIGYATDKISQRGQPAFEVPIKLIRDDKKNWLLQAGPEPDSYTIGMWPINLFASTGGLGDTASQLDWGGEVFDSDNALPPMGSGYLPIHNTYYDSYFAEVLAYGEDGSSLEADNLDAFSGGAYFEEYMIYDEDQTIQFKHLITFGGPYIA